jgi:hypothetical protein
MSIRSWSVTVSALALVAAGQTVALGPVLAAPTRPVLTHADTWGPIHRFEPDPVGQSLVVGSRDVATVVWGSQKSWPEPVKAARRTAAGRWLGPVTLGVGYDPVVATDAAGNLTVAWCRDRKGFTTGVWAARKPVGRPWSRPVHLSQDKVAPAYPDGGSVYGATNLDVAMGHGGAALVTWEWGNWERGVPFRIQAAYRQAQGRWGRMQGLTPHGEATNAHVAFALNGTAWVAFDRNPAAGPDRVVVRSRSTAGTWSPPKRIGVGRLGDLGATRRGELLVVFVGGARIRAALGSVATGAWKAPIAVTPARTHVHVWSVAMNGSGAALVAYVPSHHRVDVVRRPVGGPWTKPARVAEPSVRLSAVFAAIGPLGDMFVGWHNDYGMWGSYRAAGRGWRPPTTAQRDHGQADVLEAVQPQIGHSGDVILLWAQEERPLRARVLNAS